MKRPSIEERSILKAKRANALIAFEYFSELFYPYGVEIEQIGLTITLIITFRSGECGFFGFEVHLDSIGLNPEDYVLKISVGAIYDIAKIEFL